jgi:hypothetical protein
MVRSIVDQMAALAQALEIAQAIIARVMIEVRRRQNDAGLPQLRCLIEIGPPGWPTAAIAPRLSGGIEPTPIRQTANRNAMRPAAPLANAGGALKPYAATDL